ncbi:MAG TPA: polymer-forming cytoskeletal protein [Candidatus Binatia bacterium]|jgi:cytoskeletal protein CcmA (bactofilin family)
MAIWNQTMTPEGSSDRPNAAPVATPQLTPATPVSSTPVPSPVSAARESVFKDRHESVFGVGVAIEGKIEGNTNVRIAGKFKGDIQIRGDLNIERGAHVTAKISAANVILNGEVNGNITASGQVKLMESGQMTGDLKAGMLTVAAGSRMRGHVEFGWSGAEMPKLTNGSAHEPKMANGSAHENDKKRADG